MKPDSDEAESIYLLTGFRGHDVTRHKPKIIKTSIPQASEKRCKHNIQKTTELKI
jgi:hypothetical protein